MGTAAVAAVGTAAAAGSPDTAGNPVGGVGASEPSSTAPSVRPCTSGAASDAAHSGVPPASSAAGRTACSESVPACGAGSACAPGAFPSTALPVGMAPLTARGAAAAGAPAAVGDTGAACPMSPACSAPTASVTGCSGTSHSTPCGGSRSAADAGRPCHTCGSASTTPKLPTPDPP